MQYVSVPFAGVLGLARGGGFRHGVDCKIGVERFSVMDCGGSAGPDKARWMPGRSLGHQRRLVKRPKTGALLFSADAVHTKANRENYRAAIQNVNHAQSLATLDRMAAVLKVLKEHNAQLWSGHEPSELQLRKYARAY